MPEIKVDKEQLNEMFALHKQMLDTVEANTKAGRTLDETVTEKVSKLNARLDEIEIAGARAARTAAAASVSPYLESTLAKNFNPEKKEAYDQYLKKGITSQMHAKTLISGDATLGGFFIVPEYLQEIIKAIILISPIRKYAKIRTTATSSVKVPKRTATFAATWSNEVQQQTEAVGLRYGLDEVPNHALTAFQDVSEEDLDDSMFSLAEELNSEFAEQFAKAEGAAFVNGTSKGQPEGFMTNPAVAADHSGNATLLTYQGYVTLAHNLKSGYVPDATWFLNRQTIGATRLIVDGQNRPIWMPMATSGMSAGNESTILGMPYAEIPDMPNVGAGTYPVALGAWKKAYLIVDRINISVVRDDLTQLTRGAVRFVARKRVGGQLVLTEAVRKMLIST